MITGPVKYNVLKLMNKETIERSSHTCTCIYINLMAKWWGITEMISNTHCTAKRDKLVFI